MHPNLPNLPICRMRTVRQTVVVGLRNFSWQCSMYGQLTARDNRLTCKRSRGHLYFFFLQARRARACASALNIYIPLIIIIKKINKIDSNKSELSHQEKKKGGG